MLKFGSSICTIIKFKCMSKIIFLNIFNDSCELIHFLVFLYTQT